MPDYISRAETLRHTRQVTGCLPDKEKILLAVYARDVENLPCIDPEEYPANDVINRQELLCLQRGAIAYGVKGSFLVPVISEKDIKELPSAAPGDTLRWIERSCIEEYHGQNLPVFECPSCGLRFCDILNDYSDVYQVCPHCQTPLDGSRKSRKTLLFHSLT